MLWELWPVFTSKPNQTHWVAAKRVLQYLKGTSNLGIIFKGDEPERCKAYSDADWAGDKDDRKSTSGYLFQIASGPVSWRSKKQDTVALSTAEAEYVALSSATQECVWMRQLTSELGDPPEGPTTILEVIKRPLQWPGIHNFTGELSTLI